MAKYQDLTVTMEIYVCRSFYIKYEETLNHLNRKKKAKLTFQTSKPSSHPKLSIPSTLLYPAVAVQDDERF